MKYLEAVAMVNNFFNSKIINTLNQIPLENFRKFNLGDIQIIGLLFDFASKKAFSSVSEYEECDVSNDLYQEIVMQFEGDCKLNGFNEQIDSCNYNRKNFLRKIQNVKNVEFCYGEENKFENIINSLFDSLKQDCSYCIPTNEPRLTREYLAHHTNLNINDDNPFNFYTSSLSSEHF